MKTTDELVEKWAIIMAVGNNGGSWASHYTDAQKEQWRSRALELLLDVQAELKGEGKGDEKT